MTKAYIEKSFVVPKSQYDFVQQHTNGLAAHDYHFFCHLLKSTIIQVREHRGWVPISSVFIKHYLWNAKPAHLQKQGLILIKRHDQKRNIATKYKISPDFLQAYIESGPLGELSVEGIALYREAPKVNLFDGTKVNPFQKSILYDENRHSEPELIVNSIKAIKYSLYNQSSVLKHLNELETEYKWFKTINDHMYEHKMLDFILDLHCFESLLNQNPYPTTNRNIYSYLPAYRVQSTGRIQAIGGGLQSCSKRMKIAAYNEIPNLKIFDIAASHANIILSQMESAAIKCKWLQAYLSSPTKKYEYAEQIGINYSTWKRCLYALLMGAPVRENSENPISSIRAYIATDVASDKIEDTYQRFLTIIEPLRGPVNEWYQYLVEDYIPRNIKKVVGKCYLKNSAGKVKQLKGTWTKGQIAAFLIQGYETAFIHHLTILSHKYRYKPINNEHDALYVIGHISQQAITEAKNATGLKYLQVSEKAIEF